MDFYADIGPMNAEKKQTAEKSAPSAEISRRPPKKENKRRNWARERRKNQNANIQLVSANKIYPQINPILEHQKKLLSPSKRK